MCYVLLAVCLMFVLKCDFCFGSLNIHMQLNLAYVQCKISISQNWCRFFFLAFNFVLRLFMSRSRFLSPINGMRRISVVKLNRSETYPDKLDNLKFFECSVRCMWRRHLTVTDYYNYVFASVPTAVIVPYIDILSIDSMHSSHRSLQRKNRTEQEVRHK